MSQSNLCVSAARSEFRICEKSAYLDVAARAPMSKRVATELTEFLEVCQLYGARKQEWLMRTEGIRERFGDLVGASPEEIAFTKNTSEGLNILAHGLRLESGDNVIVCPDIEHPNNIYMWVPFREAGVEIRWVPSRDGQLAIDDVKRSMDCRTRIVSVSSVSFITGARAPIADLAELCQRSRSFLLVDAVQELGILNVNVNELGISGMAAATQKGLLGLYGAGLLYCSTEWLDQIQPTFYSRAGTDLGDAHESAVGEISAFQLKDNAAKFDLGNPNFAGLFALDASLSLLEDVGINNVERHVMGLADFLIDELTARGYGVRTPRESDRHAGIVAFESKEARQLASYLSTLDIKVSARRDVVRASLHVYNSRDDIDRLLDGIDRSQQEPQLA